MLFLRNLFGKKPTSHNPKPLSQEVLMAFFRADTWDQSQQIVEEHPELLTDDADALLSSMIAAQKEEIAKYLVGDRALLPAGNRPRNTARFLGIDDEA